MKMKTAKSQKYELTSECMMIGVQRLYRIRALKEIRPEGHRVIKPGDLGGWVENEYSLSWTGNSWVDDDAMVFGDSEVCDDAVVSGHAVINKGSTVEGNARVSVNAVIRGGAAVEGHAQVEDGAWVSDGAVISGEAKICGNAYIRGRTRIEADAYIRNNGDYITIGPVGEWHRTINFFRNKTGEIKVTCDDGFSGTIQKYYNRVVTEETLPAIYLRCIEIAKMHIDTKPIEEAQEEKE